MGGVSIVFLACLCTAFVHDASAVHCYSCVHLAFAPAPPPDVANVYKNQYCRDYSGKTDMYAGDPCPDDGQEYMCGKINGTYTFDVPKRGKTVVQSMLRRCLVKPTGLDESKQVQCMTGNKLDKVSNDINLIGGEAEAFGDMVKFDGMACYCIGNDCNAASNIGNNVVFTVLMATVLASLVI